MDKRWKTFVDNLVGGKLQFLGTYPPGFKHGKPRNCRCFSAYSTELWKTNSLPCEELFLDLKSTSDFTAFPQMLWKTLCKRLLGGKLAILKQEKETYVIVLV